MITSSSFVRVFFMKDFSEPVYSIEIPVNNVQPDYRERVDRHICIAHPSYSRSYIQKVISRGDVTVNGVTAKSNTKIKRGDCIEVRISDALERYVEPSTIPFTVLYEDSEIIAVNKSPGVIMHPVGRRLSGTLLNALHYYHRQNYPKIEQLPSFVNRLDEDTSGLVIAAKTPDTLRNWYFRFFNRNVRKEYIALVEGVPSPARGSIDLKIGVCPGQRIKREISDNGKPSKTLYKAVGVFGNHALMLLTPKTGRQHQLRVHMKAIGHPIAGDTSYGAGTEYIQRQALHSFRLFFSDPGAEKERKLYAPLPADIRGAMRKLGR